MSLVINKQENGEVKMLTTSSDDVSLKEVAEYLLDQLSDEERNNGRIL